MEPKKFMWLAALVGSAVGGYIPMLWGASAFSMSSIIFGLIGMGAGIWFVFKIQGY